jgi:ribosomal-protein-alanine N-acetyltransferase
MSVFPTEMESDRLRFEYLHPESFDAHELYEHVHADVPGIDEVTAFLSWDPYGNPQLAYEWVETCGEQFESGERATYAIRPREGEDAGTFAGLASIGPEWELKRATLGIWLRKRFWGNGYSRERAARFLELAFDRLDLEVVWVAHDVENTKSKRAIESYVERFGGTREGRIRNDLVVDGEPRDVIRYSIPRSGWAATQENA